MQLLVLGSCVPNFSKFCMEVFKIDLTWFMTLTPYYLMYTIEKYTLFYKKVSYDSSIRLFKKIQRILVLKLFLNLRVLFCYLDGAEGNNIQDWNMNTVIYLLLYWNNLNNLNLSQITIRLIIQVKTVWFNLKIVFNFLNFFELVHASFYKKVVYKKVVLH